jgi:hypothetical protein
MRDKTANDTGDTMIHRFLIAAMVLGSSGLAVAAPDPYRPLPQPLMCSQLGGTAGGLVGAAGVKAVTAAIVPATGANASYCQVDVLYGTSAQQNINVRVGLPLGPLDGGSGGAVGAWNGRTQGIGGGGCAGGLNVSAPVNAGYVGSGNDTGHAGGNCEPGVNSDGSYNLQFINDFIATASSSRCCWPSSSLPPTTAKSPPTTTGTAALPAGARAICWRRNSGASSTASWPTRRQCTGRAFKRRRCGVRSR